MSRFISKNNLDEFEFHDAYITNICIKDKSLYWKVGDLNVTTSNSRNHNDTDMCIDEAEIIFEDYEIKTMTLLGHSSYEPGATEPSEVVENRLYTTKEIDAEMKQSIGDCYFYFNYLIYHKQIGKGEAQFLYSDNYGKCLEIVMQFSNVTIKWDDYVGKAWYVDFHKNN